MSARRTGPSAATVQTVRARDEWRCARCGAGGVTLSTQHRQARGMGGTSRPAINALSNLLTLCGTGTTFCHGWVENYPTAARTLGLAVPSWDDPLTVPVTTWRGRILLDDDGGFQPVTEEVSR